MSIILKGIDLPKGEGLLTVSIYNGFISVYTVTPKDTVIEHKAQAIQIPKDHGRLIDMRALFEDLNKYQIEYNADINKVISDAPTILEAEGE